MQEPINRFTTQLHTKLILILLSYIKDFINLQNLYFIYF